MLVRKPANFGWPFCVTPDMPYVDYDFATGDVRASRSTASGRSTIAAQHGPARAAAGRAARRLVLVRRRRRCSPSCSSAVRHRHLADGRPGVPVRPGQPVAVQVAAVLQRPAALLRVEPRLHQGVPAQQAERRAAEGHPPGDVPLGYSWVDPAASRRTRTTRSTTRSTWSSARTARSTCSSTATATSPRTRTRS